MLEIKIEKSFKKDIKKAQKDGQHSLQDFELLKMLIDKLSQEKEIDLKFKRHSLKGNMSQYESLHVKNDWLLIFKTNDIVLTLVMLGKHTQVYKKFK